jgi:hypothetical protein
METEHTIRGNARIWFDLKNKRKTHYEWKLDICDARSWECLPGFFGKRYISTPLIAKIVSVGNLNLLPVGAEYGPDTNQ